MSNNINPIAGSDSFWVELSPARWVITIALRIPGFPKAEHLRTQDLNISRRNVVSWEWLTTQPVQRTSKIVRS